MGNYLLHIESEEARRLIFALAKRLGVAVRELENEDIEDFLLGKLISEGRKNDFIDNERFMKSLADKIQN